MAERLRNLSPHEHGGFGWLDRPTRLIKALAQHVTPAPIHVANITNALLVSLQRCDRCHLHGREDTVVEVRLDAGQCGYELGVAAAKAHAPAGHVVTLGEREKLNCNIPRSRDLQNAGRFIPVKNQVSVGKVVDDPEVMLLGNLYYPLKERELDTVPRGI